MPTKTEAHVDSVLTNMSVAYMQDASVFIADKVFPTIPVKKQSDIYYVYNKGDFLRDEMQVRAGGTESAGGEYGVEAADPYYAKVYGFHKDVNPQERANMDDPLDADIDAQMFVTQKMLIKREATWSSKYFGASIWGTDVTGKSANPSTGEFLQFNVSTSDPIGTITNQGIAMAAATGFKPNTIIASPHVFNALKNHEDILDRIKYTQRGMVTAELLAALFEVDRFLVPWGVKNSADKRATDAIDFIMGKHMLMCYVPPRPGLRIPSAGYTFAWTGLEGAGAYGNRIVRIPMDQLGLGTERIEGEIAYDQKTIATDLGIFFKDAVG